MNGRLVLWSLIGILCSPGFLAAEEPPVHPYVVLTGSDSSVAKKENLRITTAEQWNKVWEKHVAGRRKPGELGTMQVPVVDFQNCMVTAIFLGSTVNTAGFEVVSSSQLEKEIILRMDILSYQTTDDYDKVTPYAFLIMPRSIKPIRIQIDSRGIAEIADNLPPVWKDFARIAEEQPRP